MPAAHGSDGGHNGAVQGTGGLPPMPERAAPPPSGQHPQLDVAALASPALEAAAAGVLVADAHGRIVIANAVARRWLGVTDVSALHPHPLGAVQVLTADQTSRLPRRWLPLSRAMRGEAAVDVELVLVSPDGSRRRLRTSSDPVRAADGTQIGAVIVGWDVTALLQEESQAERSAAQLSAVAMARRAVLADTDPREAVARAIVSVTGAVCATVMEVLGGTIEVTGQAGATVGPLRLRLDRPSIVRDVYDSGRSRLVDNHAAVDPVAGSTDESVSDRETFASFEDAAGVRLGAGCWVPVRAGNRTVGVLTAAFAVDSPPLDDADTTIRTLELLASEAALAIERDDLRRRLTAQAMTDELTGLPNLRSWRAALARMPRRGGLAILDLDHFKSVNDQAGHAAGDTMLVDFAKALQSTTRAEDLVARIGGEEFAVLCPIGSDVAVLVARLRARWSELGRSHPIPVTFSAGVAARSADEEPERTQARADEALYAAKQSGRDRCIVAAGELPLRD